MLQIDGETVEMVTNFILGGFKITADGDCSQEIKRYLLLGRKVMTNLDSMLKSRDIILPTEKNRREVAQSCPTLCDPIDYSLQCSSIHGIIQANRVHTSKVLVFPVVMYGCESWTIKKAECQRIDAF